MPPPPITPPESQPTLEAPDADPRLWLEEIEGERALAWVDAQSRATLDRYGGAAYEADRRALVELFDRPDRIPAIRRRGAFVYNYWMDASNPRGLWRRTTLARYRQPEPVWDVLLDLDALAAAEGEDWVWQGAVPEPSPPSRAILRLSRGGSDAVVLREFDLDARSFVEGGFALDEAKGGVVWLDRDALLLSSAVGDGMATRSGYARTVRLWRRGADPLAAPVLFEASADVISVHGAVDHRPVERVWFHESPGFFDSIGWLGDREGPRLRLDLPTDSEWEVSVDSLIVKLRTDWDVGGTRYPGDALLGLAWSAFLEGSRDFTILFSPGPRRVLDAWGWSGQHLVLLILDDLQPRAEVLTPRPGGGWERRGIAALPRTGVIGLARLDADVEDSTGEILVSVETPLVPPEIGLLDVAVPGELEAPLVLKRTPARFDAAGLVVTQHEAVSVDGERIPYTQVGPPDPRGDAPVHMTGYGGFGAVERPLYKAALGKMWLERGGTDVVAHIRGGGEFGTPWHDAGRLAGKHLSHEDFAAVAADLVWRSVTVPERIAAFGGSNGGLLIANMLTRHPDKFGALFCTIPLIDMRRYTKLLAGASWIDEYGDPDRPEDWAYLQHVSAYHNAEPGRAYPPILVATTRRDDRVHPGHARKFAAKLQAMGYPAWFYEPAAGGHGFGKDNAERAAFMALGFTFLRDAIGWSGESGSA